MMNFKAPRAPRAPKFGRPGRVQSTTPDPRAGAEEEEEEPLDEAALAQMGVSTAARVERDMSKRASNYGRLKSGGVEMQQISSMSDVPSDGKIVAVGGQGGFALVDVTSLKQTFNQVVHPTMSVHSYKAGTPEGAFQNVTMNGGTVVVTRSMHTGTSVNVRDPTRSSDAALSNEVRVFSVGGGGIRGGPLSVSNAFTVKLPPPEAKSVKLYALDVSPNGNRFCAAMSVSELTSSERKSLKKSFGGGALRGFFGGGTSSAAGGGTSAGGVRLVQYNAKRERAAVQSIAAEHKVPAYLVDLASAVVKYSNSGDTVAMAVSPAKGMTSIKREVFGYSTRDDGTGVPRKVELPHSVSCMDFTMDDELIAAGMVDGHAIVLINTVEWEIVGRIAMECKATWSIAFSHPDGDEGSNILAAVGTMDTSPASASAGDYRRYDGIAFLCNFQKKECVDKITQDSTGAPIPGGFAKCCSFTAEGDLLLADTRGNLLKYAVELDEAVRTEYTKRGSTTAMALSGPVGRRGDLFVAMGVRRDRVAFVRVRDDESVSTTPYLAPEEYAKVLSTPEDKAEELVAVAFSPDSRRVVLAYAKGVMPPGRDGPDDARQRRVSTRLELREVTRRGSDLLLQPTTLRATGERTGVQGSGKALEFFGVVADDATRPVVGEVQEIKWIDRSNTFAVATPDSIELFHATKIRREKLLFLAQRSRPARWATPAPRSSVHVLKKTETHRELAELAKAKRLDLGRGVFAPLAMALSNSGRVLAVGGEFVLAFMDVATKETTGRIAVRDDVILGLHFSNDDRLLAVGGSAGTVLVVDATTHLVLKRLHKMAYSPRSLAFSPDGKLLLTCSGAVPTSRRSDGLALDKNKSSFAVYSVDGAHQPLISPINASTMLAARVEGKHEAFDRKRAKALGALVEADPGIAYSVVPPRAKSSVPLSENDRRQQEEERARREEAARAAEEAASKSRFGGFSIPIRAPRVAALRKTFLGDEDEEDLVRADEQWLKPDVEKDLIAKGLYDPNAKLRMVDVLVASRETLAVEAVLAAAPGLSIVPLSAHGTPFLPSFHIAVRVRATRALKLLLLASAKAPIPLRATVANLVLPVLVANGMSMVVADFLQELELEVSGAAIQYAVDKSGHPLQAEETFELHPTWAGEGSLIWIDYDPDPAKYRAAKALYSRGASSGALPLFEERSEAELEATGSAASYYAVRRALLRGVKGVLSLTSVVWGAFLDGWTYMVKWVIVHVNYQYLLYSVRYLAYLINWLLHSLLGGVEAAAPEDKVCGYRLPLFLQGARTAVRELRFDVRPIRPRPPPVRMSGMSRPGEVMVKPLRVPLPFFSSKNTLYLMRDMPEGAFNNPCMRRTVRALWQNHFFALHVFKSSVVLATVVAYFYFTTALHKGLRSDQANLAGDLVQYQDMGAAKYMAVSGYVILAASAYALFTQFFQLLGAMEAYSDVVTGLLSGTVEYLFNGWNVSELLCIATLSYAVYGEMYATLDVTDGHVNVSGLLSLSGLFLLLRVIQVLRGFDRTGWLIMALLQNIRDMLGFIVVIAIIIAFFALSFMTLFPAHVLAPEDAALVDAANATASALGMAPQLARRRLQDDGAQTLAEANGFENVGSALLVTFDMGLFGDFDVDTFDDALNPAIAKMLFIFFMVLVGVVALNALIALLGDSYAHVQEQRQEQTLRLYASCIVEYYNSMGPILRGQRERGLAWTHILRLDADDDDLVPDEWTGQLSILRKEIASRTSSLAEAVSDIDKKLDGVVDKVREIYKVEMKDEIERQEKALKEKEEAERKARLAQEDQLRMGAAGNPRNAGSRPASVVSDDDYQDV